MKNDILCLYGEFSSSQAFPFYPADIARLQAHRVNTVSQLFDTHMSGGIDKVVSPMLMTVLPAFPTLCHIIKLFIQGFLHRPFWNKYASLKTNLTTLMNLDANLCRRYRLLCQGIFDTGIGIAPAYNIRVRDNILVNIRPIPRTFSNAYQLLWLPILTSKTRDTELSTTSLTPCFYYTFRTNWQESLHNHLLTSQSATLFKTSDKPTEDHGPYGFYLSDTQILFSKYSPQKVCQCNLNNEIDART